MLKPMDIAGRCQRGMTLIEVLISMVILAFGLLGFASLQSSMHLAEVEAYQRAQALLILQDLGDRIRANYGSAADYVTATPLGTGDAQPADCSPLAGVARDQCELSAELKGAAERENNNASVGAMVDARACVEQLQAANPASGICTAGLYRVTIVWQGLNRTTAPSLQCAQGQYGDDALRRAVSTIITLGLPRCT